MKAPAVKPTHNTSSLTGSGQLASNPTPVFDNHREGAAQLKKISEMTYNSSRTVAQRQAFAEAIGDGDHNPKHNNTGMPDTLKTGLESYSGMDLSDVKVHYNSSRPAQLQALAYAQGSDIHLGPGQEKHLPHEGWHLVQQRQGRVKPTLQMKGGVYINDNEGLEHEADVMGKRSMSLYNTMSRRGEGSGHTPEQNRSTQAAVQRKDVVQRTVTKDGKDGKEIKNPKEEAWYKRLNLKQKSAADSYIQSSEPYEESVVIVRAQMGKMAPSASANAASPASAASPSASGGLKDSKAADQKVSKENALEVEAKNKKQLITDLTAFTGKPPIDPSQMRANDWSALYEQIDRMLSNKIESLNKADRTQTTSDITVQDENTPMGQLKGNTYEKLNAMLRGNDKLSQALAKLNALRVLEQFAEKKRDNTIHIKQKALRYSNTFFNGKTTVPSPGEIQTDNGWAFFTDDRNFHKDRGDLLLTVNLIKGIKVNKSKVVSQEPVEWWTPPGSSFKFIKEGEDAAGRKTYIFEQVENGNSGDSKDASASGQVNDQSKDALARLLAEKIAEEEEWSGKEKRKNINELKEALKNKLTIPQILEALNLP